MHSAFAHLHSAVQESEVFSTFALFEMGAVSDEDRVDLDGYWNAVSADQFGGQTAIKIGKGALKGMTLSANLVSE